MDWSQIGLGGGIVVVVLGFLSFLKGERVERTKVREGFLEILRNHINHNSDVVEALHNWLREKVGGER